MGDGQHADRRNGNEPEFRGGQPASVAVDGNVLMSYSMDKTVYFSTLDQYRYNPAMIISGAVNDNVIAAAPGLVKSIDNFAQTGITVHWIWGMVTSACMDSSRKCR